MWVSVCLMLAISNHFSISCRWHLLNLPIPDTVVNPWYIFSHSMFRTMWVQILFPSSDEKMGYRAGAWSSKDHMASRGMGQWPQPMAWVLHGDLTGASWLYCAASVIQAVSFYQCLCECLPMTLKKEETFEIVKLKKKKKQRRKRQDVEETLFPQICTRDD